MRHLRATTQETDANLQSLIHEMKEPEGYYEDVARLIVANTINEDDSEEDHASKRLKKPPLSTRWIARGFTQRYGIDYTESPVSFTLQPFESYSL